MHIASHLSNIPSSYRYISYHISRKSLNAFRTCQKKVQEVDGHSNFSCGRHFAFPSQRIFVSRSRKCFLAASMSGFTLFKLCPPGNACRHARGSSGEWCAGGLLWVVLHGRSYSLERALSLLPKDIRCLATLHLCDVRCAVTVQKGEPPATPSPPHASYHGFCPQQHEIAHPQALSPRNGRELRLMGDTNRTRSMKVIIFSVPMARWSIVHPPSRKAPASNPANAIFRCFNGRFSM